MWIKFKFFERLKIIKFHGKPVKIVPLTNSENPNKNENKKKALKIFFGLYILNKSETIA